VGKALWGKLFITTLGCYVSYTIGYTTVSDIQSVIELYKCHLCNHMIYTIVEFNF